MSNSQNPQKDAPIKIVGRWFYRIVLTLIIVQVLLALGAWAKSCFYF